MSTPTSSSTSVWAANGRRAVFTLLLALAACRSEVDLHTGLSDLEANQVVAALRDDGVAAQKRAAKAGVSVVVPERDLPRATAVLAARGLPHRTAARMGEVFKKEGLISSPLEERARYIYALSQELEATLAQIDGVVVARVHVVLPEKPGPGEQMQPPSAAIFIKHLPSLEPDVIGFRVRQLVARSIPGMGAQALDRVSVVFVVADRVPERAPQARDNTPLAWAGGVAALLLVLGGAAFLARRILQQHRARKAAALPPEPAAAPVAPAYTGNATASVPTA